jgi:hypothetical protein
VRDNWDTRPNVNPYNGKPGTKDPNKLRWLNSSFYYFL